MTVETDQTPPFPATLASAVRALDERKATELTLIDVRGLSSLTDYLVFASATSEPHLRALVNTLQRELKGSGDVLGTDYTPGSGWAVVDAFHYMVHLFQAEQREFYQLEPFWNEGAALPVSPFLAEPRRA